MRQALMVAGILLGTFFIIFFFWARWYDRREAERMREPSRIDTLLEDSPHVYSIAARSVLGERERVPNWTTLWFSSGLGYEFKNADTNKLIITLGDGPDWYGARIIGRGERVRGNLVQDLFFPLTDEYSIFVPEKFDWGRGKQPAPFNDIRERERYTVDNLMENYAETIGEYLSQNDYQTIIIAGFGEGGFIAPELYFRLKDLNISGLVIIAAGGVSPYESQEILFRKFQAREPPFIPGVIGDDGLLRAFNFESLYAGILEPYRSEPFPDPHELFGEMGSLYHPTTHIWLRSFLFRRPIEFYRDINIPVLFLHGELDFRMAVESTRYVEDNLPEKPFVYIYYPEMVWHWPQSYGEFMTMRRDIAAWLEAEGL